MLVIANRNDSGSFSHAAEQLAFQRDVADATQECAPLLRLKAAMLAIKSQEHDGDLDEIVITTIEYDIDRIIMDRCGGDHELYERVIGRLV